MTLEKIKAAFYIAMALVVYTTVVVTTAIIAVRMVIEYTVTLFKSVRDQKTRRKDGVS